jgi:hypothetical protein
VAEFSGGTISSDGGALLLMKTDAKLNLLSRFSACFLDGRSPLFTVHSVEQMVRQRVLALALGYEDLNDHDRLREDPLMGMMAGKPEPGQEPLASKSTLNRMETGDGKPNRYKKITYWRDSVDQLLVDAFVEAHPAAPERIVLDIDTTDMALHGQQEGRFFHGYYGHYCYLPLYIFCGDHVLCARLRPSNIGPAVGARKEIERVVAQIRQHWPKVQIILRGDSGFSVEELMTWCEANRVDYVFGLARNSLLERRAAGALKQAKLRYEQSCQAARVFTEFRHETASGTWACKRRVVVKAEHIDGKSNPRFIVTSLKGPAWPKRSLYEDTYCARGDMENRIKEQFSLFADRVSSSTMRANQLRIYFSVIAYTLIGGLRRLGLKGTELAQAQVGTIRLKLLKIGALVKITVRKIWVRLATSYPYRALFARVAQQLQH